MINTLQFAMLAIHGLVIAELNSNYTYMNMTEFNELIDTDSDILMNNDRPTSLNFWHILDGCWYFFVSFADSGVFQQSRPTPWRSSG